LPSLPRRHLCAFINARARIDVLTGNLYRLTWDTLAIESVNERRIAVTVRTGEIVEVIRGPRPDNTRMVEREVEWPQMN
jgi:hypothetical protein